MTGKHSEPSNRLKIRSLYSRSTNQERLKCMHCPHRNIIVMAVYVVLSQQQHKESISYSYNGGSHCLASSVFNCLVVSLKCWKIISMCI